MSKTIDEILEGAFDECPTCQGQAKQAIESLIQQRELEMGYASTMMELEGVLRLIEDNSITVDDIKEAVSGRIEKSNDTYELAKAQLATLKGASDE